jgi:transcriptional regulator with XRE-family HTH domain
MGHARRKQARLAEKLLQIRLTLGLSQGAMHWRLGAEDIVTYHSISKYELGKLEPPLVILLKYARVANVSVEALIDDEIDLPAKLPSPTKSEGIRRTPTSRARGKKR